MDRKKKTLVVKENLFVVYRMEQEKISVANPVVLEVVLVDAVLSRLLLHLLFQVGLLRLLLLAPPLLLKALLLGRHWHLKLRVHGLDLGKIRIHKVAEQNLRKKVSLRIGKLDVCHAIDGSLLQDRESCVWIVNIGPELSWRWCFRRGRPQLLSARRISVRLLLVAKNGSKESILFLLAVAGLSYAVLSAFLLELAVDAVAVQKQTLPSLCDNILHCILENVKSSVFVWLFG